MMLKSSKRATKSSPRSICNGESAQNDARSAIDLEFLSIELSLARARALIHGQPPSASARGDKLMLD